MFGRLLYLLGPTLFYSCISVSSIDIRVLEPASQPIVPDITDVIVLNRTIIDETVTNEMGEPELKDFDLELYNHAGTEIIFSLAEVLNESPALDFIDNQKLLEKPAGTIQGPPDLLEPGFIGLLCDSLNSEAIISLESFMIEFPDKIELSRTGSMIHGDSYFTGRIEIRIEALWRIYPSTLSETGISDEYKWADTLVWQHSSFFADDIPDYLPSPKEAVLESAYFAALSYSRRISPYWKGEERSYFSKGNRALRQASDLLINNQLDEAEEIYNSLQNNRNQNIVSAAAFNLAYIHEMRGDYRVALTRARSSFKHRRHPVISEYIKILEDRIEKSNELDRQMGKNQ